MKKLIMFCAISLSMAGCSKYLDKKSDKTTSTIETANDLLLLLNTESLYVGPSLGIAASDEYYIPDAELMALPEIYRDVYRWNDREQLFADYFQQYNRVFYANTILSNVARVKVSSERQRNELKGMALFLRGLAFLQAAELYALQYTSGVGGNGPGIILRLNEDPNVPSVRAGLPETYRQIQEDLEAAVTLLPENAPYKNLPIKAAGHALLARFYLQTRQFSRARDAASACLALHSGLLDFSTLQEGDFPLGNYTSNPEILYYQVASETQVVSVENYPRADTALRSSYATGDLRGVYYFREIGDGTETFRNSYAGVFKPFTGVATDEVYLIRAECLAREGKVQAAMDDLNELLRHRWTAGAFVPETATSAAEALRIVLRERKKELVMRGGRWADIKRLNTEPATAITLRRKIGGQEIQLPPGDLRFAWLLPKEVIARSQVAQTPR